MTRDQLIQKAYLHAMRKATPPASGTDKFEALLGFANNFIEDWQNEAGVDWNSLWGETTVGTVTATDTFPLDTSLIRKLSSRPDDKVVITNGSQSWEYSIVSPDSLSRYKDAGLAVARIGDDLVFSRPFTATDEQFGGSISAPYFGFAPQLVDAGDPVPVDQPNWLVYMVAAEWVRNDYTKSSQYANLIALAQSCMDSMKRTNSETQHFSLIQDWSPVSETF